MRVVLVGRPKERERLRWALAGTSLDIVGEAVTIAAAQNAAPDAEAFIIGAATSDDERRTSEVETLTPRETEVLALVAEGLPNKAIATRLGISDQTVKFHVASISGKLGAVNRTDAVRLAIQRGLVTL